jgi:hypothetical protein
MAARPELRELLANVDSPEELSSFLAALEQWLLDPAVSLPPVPVKVALQCSSFLVSSFPQVEKRADPADDAWVLFDVED